MWFALVNNVDRLTSAQTNIAEEGPEALFSG
jgi:hypothetical protein